VSCCGCGCGGQQGCCLRIVLPDNPVELYASENINTLGIGVYDSTDGTTFQFRGVYSDSAALTVSLDAGNNAIKLSLDGAAIVNDLPQATTTQIGVGETSTDAEAIAKASITTFLTPSNLAALGASTTFIGLIEISTDAEALAGVSAVLALTPANLTAVLATIGSTEVWADAVARAAADPDFTGQFGTQIDTFIPYISSSAAVGGFDFPLMVLGNAQNQLPASTIVDLNTFTMEFQNGDFVYQGGGAFFDNGQFRFGSSASLDVDFGAQARVYAANVIVPANSVFITTGTAGEFSSSLINTFVSNANVQTYGLPTSVLARTTFATYGGQTISNPPTQAEVQALDDAVVIASQRLGALITDLMATLKPHA